MKRRHFILSMLSAGLAGQLRSTKDSRADMTTMGGMSETPAVGSTGQAKPVTIRTGQPLRTLPKLVNQSKTPGVFEARLTAVPARLDVGAGQRCAGVQFGHHGRRRSVAAAGTSRLRLPVRERRRDASEPGGVHGRWSPLLQPAGFLGRLQPRSVVRRR